MCRSMRGIGLILIALLLLADSANATQYAFEVRFTDKQATPYSLSSPLAYLSSRAMARRTIQGIAVDSTDIPVNATYINNVLTTTGGKFHEASRWMNMVVILLTDTSLLHNLDAVSYVKSIKLVGIYTVALHKSSNPQTTTTKEAHKSTAWDASYYGATWQQTAIVHGDFLHNNGLTGAGKMIAVLDAGFQGVNTIAGFSNMRTGGRLVDTHNFTFANDNVYADDVHGEEVLSTMAGDVPNGYVGSAPGAMYALYTTEHNTGDQPLELDNLLCATERADSVGADIVTISLGYEQFDAPFAGQDFATEFDGKTTLAAKAANIATSKGMLFVATAGNEGITAWHNILTPGDADSALTVGATDVSGSPAPLSGYGPNAAGQVKPDVCTIGAPANIINSSGAYSSVSGTSFSTPQIAGWAACLWQAHPFATPYQLRQAIIRCASSYSSPGVQLGYGVPDFQCTQGILDVAVTPPPFTSANWIIVAPNPFMNELNIAASPAANEQVDFVLLDMAGRTVSSFSRFLYKGYNKPFTASIPELPSGMYILKAVSATQQHITKLEKL